MVFKSGACCVIKHGEDEKIHVNQNGFGYNTKTELYLKRIYAWQLCKAIFCLFLIWERRRAWQGNVLF